MIYKNKVLTTYLCENMLVLNQMLLYEVIIKCFEISTVNPHSLMMTSMDAEVHRIED
jgi:hypothetical protein